jgi:hypothetical protein
MFEIEAFFLHNSVALISAPMIHRILPPSLSGKFSKSYVEEMGRYKNGINQAGWLSGR